MASKAWFKPSALPRLAARFESPSPSPSGGRGRRRAVEVWTTTCIVTNFGMRTRSLDDDGGEIDATSSSPSASSSSASSSPPPLQLPRCTALINPSNPGLTGPNSFPYFPRGGPQPPRRPDRDAHHIMGYVTQWGGMDVGGGMMFSAETVDGLVHQLGGVRLRAECSMVPTHRHAREYSDVRFEEGSGGAGRKNVVTVDRSDAKCPEGMAIMTAPGGEELGGHYDWIIHATPPFYDHPPPETEGLRRILGMGDERSDSDSWRRALLGSCYRRSFDVAFGKNAEVDADMAGMASFLRDPLSFFRSDGIRARQPIRRVAVPLLGAGCRGFPKEVALDVAAAEGASWLLSKAEDGRTDDAAEGDDVDDAAVVFGLLEDVDADALSERIERIL